MGRYSPIVRKVAVQLDNTVRVAWQAIMTNKSRSFLTMLGVIIGVGSVILLTSIGTGIQRFIEEQFEGLGAQSVVIYPFQVFNDEGGFSDADEQISSLSAGQFTLQDIRALEKYTDLIEAVMPEASGQDTVAFQGSSEKVPVVGTTVAYEVVRNTKAEKGRWFTSQEESSGQRVAMLGSNIAEELFGNTDPVNKTIRLGGTAFTVVGVAESKGGGFGGPRFDDYVIIPLDAFFRMYDTREFGAITVKVRRQDLVEPTIDRISEYMLNEADRDEEEFEVFDQRQILDSINQILSMLTLALGGIAAISLVVGGIGIMNIMLVSVTERTREIGLRKALGATPNQILVQFLIESALLSVLGGMIGVGIAATLSLLVSVLAGFPSAITISSVMMAFSVSFIVGVVFGVVPARKASQLPPIEALRYE